MKQIILLATACCLITFSKAQITKGSTMIGGSIGFSNSSENTYSSDTFQTSNISNSFSLQLSYAKCFKENTFWGISAGFTTGNTKYKYSNALSNNKATNNTYNFGIFERKYFPIIKNFYFFGQGNLNYSYNSNNNPDQNTYYKTYGIGFSFTPGISYKVSKNIYLESTLANLISFGYNHDEYIYNTYYNYPNQTNNPINVNSDGFNTRIQLPTQILQNLNVGMTIILGK